MEQTEQAGVDFAMTYRPSLWRRLRIWHRWPWRPREVSWQDHEWDAQWVTVVRQNGVIVGWHTNEQRPTGYGIRPDRWACLVGLLTGRLEFYVETCPGERGSWRSVAP